MKGKRDYSGVCRGPDRDVPGLICGHPLPCPRHPKDQEKNQIKEKTMSNDQPKEVRSTEIHSKISGNLELARSLSKIAAEIEDKILGTQTPYGEAAEEKEPSGGFITHIDRGLRALHSELLHLKDILNSINAEF